MQVFVVDSLEINAFSTYIICHFLEQGRIQLVNFDANPCQHHCFNDANRIC